MCESKKMCRYALECREEKNTSMKTKMSMYEEIIVPTACMVVKLGHWRIK